MFSNQTNSIITRAFNKNSRPEVILSQLRQAGIIIPLISVIVSCNKLKLGQSL